MGSFGRWQLGIALAIALSGLPGAWFKVGIVFLAPPVDFWCVDPRLVGEENTTSKYTCSVPVETPEGERMESCQRFEYNRSIFTETVVTEWNLVCERKQLGNVVQVVFMLGLLVGCFLGGIIADKHGRKPPLLWGSVLQVAAGIFTALVPWFSVFLVMRFLSAMAVGAISVTGFVILMEIIGGKWRTSVNIIGGIPFSVGHCMLAGMAWMMRDWRDLQLVISIVGVLQLLYYWLVPESPRWLLAVGRDSQAVDVLKEAAKANRIGVTDWDKALATFKISQFSGPHDDKDSKPGLLTLFRTPVMRRCSLVMFANWFACGLVFYGLVQYMGHIAGNIFLNAFLSGVIETPGIIMSVILLVKIGRRRTLIIAQTFAGLSCLAIVLVPTLGLPDWVTVALAALGVMGMSTAFPCVYIYSAELFPTVVRNIGIGTASTIARVGSIVSPFIATLNAVSPILPPILFGVTPLIAGLFVMMLPETHHRELPDTVAEVENYNNKTKNSRNGEENSAYIEDRL